MPGVVVAGHPAAAKAGAAMLRRGGNAVDAACAAAWALSVCEPAESGLGGQATALIRFADGRLQVVDGHSRAPAALTRTSVKRADQDYGIRACSIPSCVATLASMQQRWGRLTLADVISPAIELACEGYRVTRLYRRLLGWSQPYFGPAETAVFMSSGALPQVGSISRQPLLARTLDRIAQRGADDFYCGEIAREIIGHMETAGGLIDASDLAHLGLPIDREPLSIDYGGYVIHAPPPPAGGVQVLLAMRLLRELWDGGPDVAAWRLAMAQATWMAFRERERWPDHPADMSPSLANWLVSTPRAMMLAERFAAGEMASPVEDSIGEEGNTTHLCTADGDGMVVSLTQSIQSVFGSKTVHPTLGFVYNNYLSTCPRRAHPYRLGPASLPQSNASPTIVVDSAGNPVLALGSAGSRRITTSVVQVLSGVLDRRMSLGDAVSLSRAHALLSREIWAEESIGAASRTKLSSFFSPIRQFTEPAYKLGAVHAIGFDESGNPEGSADPRRDGAVVKLTSTEEV